MILLTSAECDEFGNCQLMKANSSFQQFQSRSDPPQFSIFQSSLASILSSLSPLHSLELWVPIY